MTDPVYRCPEHGYVTGVESSEEGDTAPCPECEAEAERVLSGERRRRLSKFASGALRHFPADAGLELDEQGWADYDDLVAAVTAKYDRAAPEHVAAVVETDPKGRFERNGARSDPDERAATPRAGGRIRATYGHSVDVRLESETGDVPDRLFHGTAPENVKAILREGLKPMERQEVHLSATPETAREVGRRHATDPILFEIDAAVMVADGHRISERGPETYAADAVPPEYLDTRNDSRTGGSDS